MTTELDPIDEVVSDEIETPEVVEAPEPVVVDKTPPVVKEPTMEDTLRAKLKEMGGVPKTDVDTGLERGPDGKFIAKASTRIEKPAVATPVVDPAKPVVDAPVVTPEVKPVGETIKPPSSWKKEAQAVFAKADPLIQQEVLRREQDFHKGISDYKRRAELFNELDAEIQPYAAMIRAAGLTPQSTIRAFMNTAYKLQYGSMDDKVATLADLAAEYKIDAAQVPAILERLQAGVPAVDPKIAELEQRLAAQEQTFEQQKQEQARQEFAVVADEVAKFKAAPGHEHYEAVKLTMAALIESGQADGIPDAYQQAVWTHPEVRAKLQAEQQATERKQRAEKAALAKKASVTNVATRGTLPSAPAVAGTMEETIRTKLRELNGV